MDATGLTRRELLVAGAATIVGGVMARRTRAAALASAIEATLHSADLIYVATQRRNGERSTAAPIWFFYRGDGELFFTTSPASWKAKRIARKSPLFINVGRANGPALVGAAREVTDANLVDRMGQAYAKKYWIAWLGFFKPRSARVTAGKTKAYLVTLNPPPK
jgi:hypothetical protein